MNEKLEFGIRAVVIGICATAVMDLWTASLTRFFGVRATDWAMVGRWVGHFKDGQFVHDKISQASPVHNERVLGWFVHYAIGIVFAALLLTIFGLDWARRPTVVPALIFGIVTVAAPFIILQPGMGSGIAASKMPNPMTARLRSVTAHTVFGIGLYASALLSALLIK